MTTDTKPITAGDLQQMSAGVRCELIRGEVIELPPPGFHHGAVIDNVAFLLSRQVRSKRLGKVFGAETGFRLFRNPDTVRGADVSFVSADRLPARPEDVGYLDGSPDLVVEVISPSDTVAYLDAKVDDYLKAGAKAVWVVNPMRKAVTVYRPGGAIAVLRDADEIDAGEAVPGFRCAIAEFFA